MKIFLSWSGARSRVVAESLKDWLPMVLHFVEPWMSDTDIQPGDRWSNEVARQLEQCNFGILCVTPENLMSPWLLFEAGALAKSVDEGRVVPFLLDLDFGSISGPLAQFQAKKCEPNSLREIIFSINKIAPSPIEEKRLDAQCTALLDNFFERMKRVPDSTTERKATRDPSEVLEDVVAVTRSSDQKIDELARLVRSALVRAENRNELVAHSPRLDRETFNDRRSLRYLKSWMEEQLIAAPPRIVEEAIVLAFRLIARSPRIISRDAALELAAKIRNSVAAYFEAASWTPHSAFYSRFEDRLISVVYDRQSTFFDESIPIDSPGAESGTSSALTGKPDSTEQESTP